MKFIDHTEIDVRSGDGGHGLVSFRAAKYQPKAGLDGGDGGFGGHVYLVGNAQLNSLSSLYYRRMYAAENGGKGGTNNCTGADGEDLLIPVPVGTIAYDRESGRMVAEVLEDGQKVLLAEGGLRGLGNCRFVTSSHQAAEESTDGTEGKEIKLQLELKLIADVGFAGFPNAGKSTLLSVISSATPKIADYPFTTLTPQLGVVEVPGADTWHNASFVAADIPGLIEGASEGKGLGHEFLRHLERTKVIAFILDTFPFDEMPPFNAFRVLESELFNFSEKMHKKKRVIILSKADLAPEGFNWDTVEKPFRDIGLETVRVSSVVGTGIPNLKRRVFELIQEEKHKIDIDAVTVTAPKEEDSYTWLVRAHEDAKFGI
ncbi:MAG: GTPase ObgE [Chitinophagaceae bacterium]|nr:GTPase ObgE [Oligoflexus sp.]